MYELFVRKMRCMSTAHMEHEALGRVLTFEILFFFLLILVLSEWYAKKLVDKMT